MLVLVDRQRHRDLVQHSLRCQHENHYTASALQDGFTVWFETSDASDRDDIPNRRFPGSTVTPFQYEQRCEKTR